MGTNNCKFQNDTRYDVVIEDYDGTRILRPGQIQSNYLITGPHYVNLVMKFPGFGEEKISFPGSQYQDRTHYMSDLFRQKIREYEQSLAREEERKRREAL